MPHQLANRPLSAFIKALRKEKIDCILIGAMAAIEQGAPLTTIDYDFWVKLPQRQYVRILAIVQKQHGVSLGKTLYELRNGTQVNVVFNPDGLHSFDSEFKKSKVTRLEGEWIRVLPLQRVIASKQIANREKDIAVLPILKRTLRMQRRLQK